MTGIRELAIAEIETRLRAIPSHKVLRNPPRALALEDFPALVLLAKSQAEAVQQTGVDINHVGVTVTIYAAGDGAATAVNASYVLVIAALVTEPPLGGLVTDLVEAAADDPEILDAAGFAGAVAMAVRFRVTYLTAADQPDVAA